MKQVMKIALVACAIILSVPAQADELQKLLQQIRSDVSRDRSQDAERLQAFQGDHNRQLALLNDARKRLAAAEAEQERLKAEFQANEDALTEQGEALRMRSGQLGEVFGVVKQQAQELQGQLSDSLITAEYPQRDELLAFAELKRIPLLAELEGLWFLLQQEMTATGEVAPFTASVVKPDGSRAETNVLRIGPFTALTSEGHYLNYENGVLQQLPVQPDSGVITQARDFMAGQGNVVVVDPSRGNLLALLAQTPDLKARIAQGGLVGYIILSLGGIGLLVALWKLMTTITVELSVRKQLRQPQQAHSNNPLGRVMQAGGSGRPTDATGFRVAEAPLQGAPLL